MIQTCDRRILRTYGEPKRLFKVFSESSEQEE